MKKILLIIIIVSFLIACIDRPRVGDVTIYDQRGGVIDTYTNVKIISANIAGISFEMDEKIYSWSGSFDVFYKEAKNEK